jgi:CrcB protein
MQDTLITLAWVALGTAFGGPARYFISGVIGRRFGETFPWGTTVVNATGALAIGVAAAAAVTAGPMQTPATWQLVVVGLLGSYTTVSSFSLQTLALARDGQIWQASGNVLLSLVLCLAAVALGFAAGAAWLGAPLR